MLEGIQIVARFLRHEGDGLGEFGINLDAAEVLPGLAEDWCDATEVESAPTRLDAVQGGPGARYGVERVSNGCELVAMLIGRPAAQEGPAFSGVKMHADWPVALRRGQFAKCPSVFEEDRTVFRGDLLPHFREVGRESSRAARFRARSDRYIAIEMDRAGEVLDQLLAGLPLRRARAGAVLRRGATEGASEPLR